MLRFQMNKLDDDLCDYHGKCWRTYLDYECIDTMNDVLYETDYRIKWPKKDVFSNPSNVESKPLCSPSPEMLKEWEDKGLLSTLGDVLSDSDKDLLEEYIPQLFNTMIGPKNNLDDAIYMLIVLIRSYRDALQEQGWFTPQFEKYDAIKGGRSKKGKEKDAQTLKTKIDDIFFLIGGGRVSDKNVIINTNPKTKELMDVLVEAYNNPNAYLLDNPKFSISKAPISDYLSSLDLPGKSGLIKEFMKKI